MQILSAQPLQRNDRPSPTLGQIADEWLESLSSGVKFSTLSAYSAIAAKYIPEELRSKPVSRATASDIRQLLRAAEHPPGRAELSLSRMHSISTVICSILDYARGNGLSAVVYRQERGRSGAARHEIDPLTLSEQERLEKWLLANLDESTLGVLICLYTGLRLGEICAIKWGDVSFADSALRVRRTVQRVSIPGGGGGEGRTRLMFDTPKSRSANRFVPLPAFLLDVMRPFRGDDAALILTGSAERCIEPRTYQNRFHSMLRAAGLRQVNFHTLRHTFATSCISLGCDTKTQSEILGHADVGVTLNIYVHPSVPAKRELVERLSGRSGHATPDCGA